jgi:hypothetical protein
VPQLRDTKKSGWLDPPAAEELRHWRTKKIMPLRCRGALPTYQPAPGKDYSLGLNGSTNGGGWLEGQGKRQGEFPGPGLLGLTPDEHIQNVITGMQGVEKELGF